MEIMNYSFIYRKDNLYHDRETDYYLNYISYKYINIVKHYHITHHSVALISA